MHSCNMSHPSAQIKGQRTDVGKGIKMEKKSECTAQDTILSQDFFFSMPFQATLFFKLHFCYILKKYLMANSFMYVTEI